MTRCRKVSPSARARALRAQHPGWSLSRIAAKVGITKQGVANALRQTGPIGRPPKRER